MRDDQTINNAVNVHPGENDRLAGWFDAQPRACVRSSRRYTRGHPFPFGDLAFNRDMEIGIGLANANHVCFGSLDTYGVPFAVMNLGMLCE